MPLLDQASLNQLEVIVRRYETWHLLGLKLCPEVQDKLHIVVCEPGQCSFGPVDSRRQAHGPFEIFQPAN